MQPSVTGDRRLTYEDFLLFPDDGMRHEIIDGVHYVTPSPVLRHQQLLGRLYFSIAEHLRAHPSQGEVFFAPLDVIFSNWDIVEPDLLLVAGDQLEILTEKNVVGAPALVVEILSQSTRSRDRHLKRQLFERGGSREYWIVDPDRNAIQVFRRDGNGAFSECELSAAASSLLTTSILPGWKLDVEQFFV